MGRLDPKVAGLAGAATGGRETRFARLSRVRTHLAGRRLLRRPCVVISYGFFTSGEMPRGGDSPRRPLAHVTVWKLTPLPAD